MMEQFMKSRSYLINLHMYRDTKNTFKIVLFLLLLNDVFGAEPHKVNVVSVEEGKDVALLTGETEIKSGDNILWMFGDDHTLLAEIHLKNKIFGIYDNRRFGSSLELDRYTGSLIIKNTKSTHSGVYHMKIIKQSATVYKRFQVNVSGGEKSKPYMKKPQETLPIHDIVKMVLSFMFAGLIGLVLITCCFWCM